MREVLTVLERESEHWNAPVKILKKKTRDPFRLLIGAIISTRTKDEVTAQSVERLFSLVKTPEDLAKLDVSEIEKLIYPCGFYRNKAKILKNLAEILVKDYGGKVPDTMEELLKLPGVGRKVANIVLSRAFGKDAIAVDTHVHRISNRLGLVRTKSPEETEKRLMEVVPKEWFSRFNELLVAFGQVICRPISPKCHLCPIESYCPRIGVRSGKRNR